MIVKPYPKDDEPRTLAISQELIDALTKDAYTLPAGNLTENALANALALAAAGATVVIR